MHPLGGNAHRTIKTNILYAECTQNVNILKMVEINSMHVFEAMKLHIIYNKSFNSGYECSRVR